MSASRRRDIERLFSGGPIPSLMGVSVDRRVTAAPSGPLTDPGRRLQSSCHSISFTVAATVTVMRILASAQRERVSDAVRSKFAMVAPVLDATLYSLNSERVARFGGVERVTLWDLAREVRGGTGDAGICFEYAVHDGIKNRHALIYPRASEALERFCGIPGGAASLLFGPEKDGRIPILQSVQDALTDESRLYVGNRGQPPKLKRYVEKIFNAFRRQDARVSLPASIGELWKADLFIGNPSDESWVGTTVKINPQQLRGARGLRIGIYPQANARDVPRKDADLNLIRLPLPYDGAFMELYYKAFNLVRAFLKADARVPAREWLPDSEDRYIAKELEDRREFAVLVVADVLRGLGQEGLLDTAPVTDVPASTAIAEDVGLVTGEVAASELVSLTPLATEQETLKPG